MTQRGDIINLAPVAECMRGVWECGVCGGFRHIRAYKQSGS